MQTEKHIGQAYSLAAKPLYQLLVHGGSVEHEREPREAVRRGGRVAHLRRADLQRPARAARRPAAGFIHVGLLGFWKTSRMAKYPE